MRLSHFYALELPPSSSSSSISGLNDVVWRGVTQCLSAVQELSIRWCDEIKYIWESEATASMLLASLRKLEVEYCTNLLSLGEEEEGANSRSNLETFIRTLEVSDSQNMERCICPNSVEALRIEKCISMTVISLPTGGHKLKSLYISNCKIHLERDWDNRSNMSMLEKLNIHDWPNMKSITELVYMVYLTELSIESCENMESFPDNELPSLTSLTKLVIKNCPSIDACFPRGFWPPSLRTLTIGKLKKPISEWGQQNFPTSLVELSLWGEDGVTSCSQFSNLLPLSLTSLCIQEFEKLESVLTGLQHLTTLQHLHFSCCPNVRDLPETLLPSLLSLRVGDDCPILKERCTQGGYYWPLISHIPCIHI